jgi:hypothetical protein
MSTEIPKELSLVRINLDGEEAIANLYGIGSLLAKRVVEYREANGYFYKPADLAHVKGISLDLAITLSPHIDWQIPEGLEQSKPREWILSILTFLGALSCLYILINGLVPRLTASIANYSSKIPNAWISICISTSILISNIAFTSGLIILAASYMTSSPTEVQL